jgi:hypothetical protein
MVRPMGTATAAQAFASGLQLDPAAWRAGYADGAAGARWQPNDFDVLAYASGYFEGRLYGPLSKKGG